MKMERTSSEENILAVTDPVEQDHRNKTSTAVAVFKNSNLGTINGTKEDTILPPQRHPMLCMQQYPTLTDIVMNEHL